MRILHILPSYFPAVRYGGPTFAVHGLCRALAARGHRVEVFTTNIDGPENSAVPLGTPVQLDGVSVRYFPSGVLRRVFWSPALGRALQREIKSFDVVHLHSVFLWPTWAAARFSRDASIPYIISPRGMLVKELIRRRSFLAKSLWIRTIEKGNLERAAAIHVTSQLEADELIRFGWSLPRVVIIPNGIDEIINTYGKVVSADVLAITEEPYILCLGRISWKKGLDRLLKAFALTKIPNLGIVGPDDENIGPRLDRLIRDLNLGPRVRILPRTVLDMDKEHLYASAQLFVLASYSENFGNTVLEAMQRGIPVIVTPEVGAAKIVQKAGCGLVVSGDPQVFGAAIGRLLEDGKQARIIGQAGRRHVSQAYGWSRVAGQMESLYETLVGQVMVDNTGQIGAEDLQLQRDDL